MLAWAPKFGPEIRRQWLGSGGPALGSCAQIVGSQVAGKPPPRWHQVSTETTPSPQSTILLNLNEVATRLPWNRRSVERLIAERRLRTVHLGRSVRVERTELDRLVASMRDAQVG